jgi:hypothetical protein
MKVHSLKLTIQDLPDENGDLFAGVFGSLVMDTEEVAKNEDGTDRMQQIEETFTNEKGEEEIRTVETTIPILEDVQFIFPLNKDEIFKGNIQAILIEALTQKNWEIAKENGQLSHFIQAVGANVEEGEGLEDKPTQDADTQENSKE